MTALFSIAWKTPKNGTLTLIARAADAAGNTSVSNPVTLEIKADAGKKGGNGRKKNGQHRSVGQPAVVDPGNATEASAGDGRDGTRRRVPERVPGRWAIA